MAHARRVAEALSDGLNCASAIVDALEVGAPGADLPMDEWVGTLRAMGDALEAILAKEVTTALIVHQGDCDVARRLAALVSDWATTRQPPHEVRAVAVAVLRLSNRSEAESAPDGQE